MGDQGEQVEEHISDEVGDEGDHFQKVSSLFDTL
jgi:hypothetical protein